VISPILANLYLRHVLDLWARHGGRSRRAGDMIIVRYADDGVLGFEREEDAKLFLEQLQERLRKFGLELHPEKTRLIEFGRYAVNDGRSGEKRSRKPSTFWFHPHLWDQPYDGQIHRASPDDRQAHGSQVTELRAKLRQRMHTSPRRREVARASGEGVFQYHAIPGTGTD